MASIDARFLHFSREGSSKLKLPETSKMWGQKKLKKEKTHRSEDSLHLLPWFQEIIDRMKRRRRKRIGGN